MRIEVVDHTYDTIDYAPELGDRAWDPDGQMAHQLSTALKDTDITVGLYEPFALLDSDNATPVRHLHFFPNQLSFQQCFESRSKSNLPRPSTNEIVIIQSKNPLIDLQQRFVFSKEGLVRASQIDDNLRLFCFAQNQISHIIFINADFAKETYENPLSNEDRDTIVAAIRSPAATHIKPMVAVLTQFHSALCKWVGKTARTIKHTGHPHSGFSLFKDKRGLQRLENLETAYNLIYDLEHRVDLENAYSATGFIRKAAATLQSSPTLKGIINRYTPEIYQTERAQSVKLGFNDVPTDGIKPTSKIAAV